MRNAKMFLFGAFLAAALAGTAVLLGTSSGRAEPVRERAAVGKDHWEHHDGHWSYWNECRQAVVLHRGRLRTGTRQ